MWCFKCSRFDHSNVNKILTLTWVVKWLGCRAQMVGCSVISIEDLKANSVRANSKLASEQMESYCLGSSKLQFLHDEKLSVKKKGLWDLWCIWIAVCLLSVCLEHKVCREIYFYLIGSLHGTWGVCVCVCVYILYIYMWVYIYMMCVCVCFSC